MSDRAEPVTWEKMQAAMNKVMATLSARDRYVIPEARWHSILSAASPEFRRELESLLENGTIILNSFLPDDDHAYRIQLPDAPIPHPKDYWWKR
jgi:hypothetical protein